MDKAFARIMDLEEALEVIEDKNLQNTQEIMGIIENICSIEDSIECLEDVNKHLEINEQFIEEAPKRRKKAKKELINSLLLAYLVATITASVPVCIGSGNLAMIFPCLGTATLLTAAVSSVVIPIQFKSINKKYPIENTDIIENDIKENNKKIESLNEEKKELYSKEETLKEKRKIYEEKIREINKELEYTRSLRLKVIIDYCNNNKVLDDKINEKYEKSSIQKVKIK